MRYLLIGSELWPTSSDAALLTSGIQSSLSSLAENCSFELGKCSDHLHHRASWSSGGINRFRQTPESGFSFLNPFHNHQIVPERRGTLSAGNFVPKPDIIRYC